MSGLTKGVGFTNVRSFLLERFGEMGEKNVFAAMEPSDRQGLQGIIPMGWYDLALYARLIRTVDRVYGKGDLSLLPTLGRYEAEQDLTSIHRLFMRVANPGLILEKTMDLWRRFHDTGEWKVLRRNNAATGTLTGWGVVDEALCQELTGYIEGIISVGNGRDVHVRHVACKALGAPACVFEGDWR